MLERANLRRVLHSGIGAAFCNFLLAMTLMMFSRVIFFAENYATFAPSLSWSGAGNLLKGALTFDISALFYINSLYLVITLFPLHHKEQAAWWNKVTRFVFVLTNSIGLALNLIDSVYFQYSGRRTTMTVFRQFANEDNLGSIFLTEFFSHWYLVIAMAVLAWLLWRCFTTVKYEYSKKWQYYLTQVLSLTIVLPLALTGIRGSIYAGTKPININNANQWVKRPVETALVLNTPFTMIRSVGKMSFVTPSYMSDAEMEREYTPVQDAVQDSISLRGRERKPNIVIIIVESMSKEFVGSLNGDIENGTYKGFMPFVDSLVSRSLTFKYSYANGRISVDAMPSILCGLPMMVESFFLTPASLNDKQGLPMLLKPMGYKSAFLHGGHNISMGFSAFANSIGYDEYYGLDEYCADKNYGGMNDFDGKWAIWDEQFLQFSLDKINDFNQPFLATVFTASSHHPFSLPEKYKTVFRDDGIQPIHKTVSYTDFSLKRFFERAQQMPWYDNTIFVIVADHTNQPTLAPYLTDLGHFSVPIIFFTPDGSIKPELRDDIIAQQTDITPTLLHLVGYEGKYLAFGCDLLSTRPADSWAFSYTDNIYQYCQGDWLMQFDGDKVTAMYRFRDDPLLKINLVNTGIDKQPAMERHLKAIIRQYMSRMNENRLLPE